MTDLNGNTAAITGSGSGTGFGFVRGIAQAGMAVFLRADVAQNIVRIALPVDGGCKAA